MPITYLDAIREAQARALAEDPRVFIYGQDVGSFGGAFKATKNLAPQFPGRVLDAPISEDAMLGLAVGAAIEGMRPIIEIQFAVTLFLSPRRSLQQEVCGVKCACRFQSALQDPEFAKAPWE